MLVAVQDVSKDYGPRQVLGGVSLAVQPGDRLGLVGRNGAGKTTLLRLLTGELVPDSGVVRRGPGVQVRTLAQDPQFVLTLTVEQVLEAAFQELDELEAELAKAAEAMSGGTPESVLKHEELLEHYARRGGFERRSRKDAVLLAFGFRGREQVRVSQLSGGERTRLGLAALLVESPDVLLLDEPTNHLDIEMVEWLEGFLGRYNGAVLMISHDRAFLDRATRETAYLRDGTLKVYPGAYSRFREALEQEQEQLAARQAIERQQIANLQASADRMKIWGLGMSKLARRAKAMQTRVDRLKTQAGPPPLPQERSARITFYAPPCGDVVLDARGLTRRVQERVLFKDLNLQVRRGERIAIIGRNGAGKTTLLRTLLGLDPSDDSQGRTLTGARVSVGYYDQALRSVDPQQTLYQVAREYVQKDKEAHDLLGTYLFPYEQHDKPAKLLSGGEKARLALLKLAQEDHNLLVMDEPTNHLDLEMVEALETALEQFSGTLLMVSHDRAFIQGLADRVWLLEDGQWYEYLGWEEYRHKHPVAKNAQAFAALREPRQERPTQSTAAVRPASKNQWQLKQEIAQLEAQISELEGQLQQAHQALNEAGPDADFAQLGRVAHQLTQQLEHQLEEWEAKQGLLTE